MTDLESAEPAKQVEPDSYESRPNYIQPRDSCDKMMLPPWFMMDSGTTSVMTNVRTKGRRKTSGRGSPSSSNSNTFSIFLEEGKEVPVFWNGESTTTMIKWSPSNTNENFQTIQDFLSFYAAEKYVRNCSICLQVSQRKYINNLKLSDPFSALIDQTNADTPCNLLLSHNENPENDEGYSQYQLYIREINGKKVLWNGKVSTNKIVAKLNQSDISLSIKDCLKNYVARGYLSDNCQVDLVKESNDETRSSKVPVPLVPISKDELVSSIFKGIEASLVIRNVSYSKCLDSTLSQTATSECPSTEFAEENAENESATDSADIPTFKSPPAQCNWVGKTWEDISQEVRNLVHSVERTVRDTILPADTYFAVYEKKRILELANRKRSVGVDQIWRLYVDLSIAHNQILDDNLHSRRPRQNRVQLIGSRIHYTDSGHPIGQARSSDQGFLQRSYLQSLSSCMIKYGMELEFFDEEMDEIRRYAGIGVGIAVALAIFAIIYYS